MGAISFFIFFFTLLFLARQVSHSAQPSKAFLGRVRLGLRPCGLVPLPLCLNLISPELSPNSVLPSFSLSLIQGCALVAPFPSFPNE